MQDLQPVLWFQFFSSEEDQALREWEAAVLGAPLNQSRADRDLVKPLSAPLAWVTQYFDPHSPEVGCARNDIESFRSSDSGTFKSAENGCSSATSSDDGVSPHFDAEPAGAHASTSAPPAMQHGEGETAGTSGVSGDDFASGASDSESDSESEEWILGADEAQRLKTTCGRHKCASYTFHPH